jgi:hypothetical protein
VPEPPEGLRYEKVEHVEEADGTLWLLQFSMDGLQHVARGATMREAALDAIGMTASLSA